MSSSEDEDDFVSERQSDSEDEESTLKYFQAAMDFLKSAVDSTDTCTRPTDDELSQLLKDLKKDVMEYFADPSEEEWGLEHSATREVNEFHQRTTTRGSVSPPAPPAPDNTSDDSDRQSQFKRLCKCSDEEFLQQIQVYEGLFNKDMGERPKLFAHESQRISTQDEDHQVQHIPTKFNIKHVLMFERADAPDVAMHEAASLGDETDEVARIKLAQHQMQKLIWGTNNLNTYERFKETKQWEKKPIYRMASGIPLINLEPCIRTDSHAMMLKDGSFVKLKKYHGCT
eukprot:m.34943 g.34943  ORF g.34943 m.34943 type:complete len:285 (-) comp17059_c0_seq1:70-924(-)